VSSELRLVVLERFTTTAEAEMVKELLAQEGIGAIVSGLTDPLAVVSGAVVLFVDEADLMRARELYRAFFRSEVEPLNDLSSEP